MSHHAAATAPAIHGLMAEFDSAQALLDAATAARKAGYTRVDAYSPFPIHGLAEAIGFRERLIPKFVFVAGATGGTLAFSFQYWVSAIDYPLNIGGRPYFSWVSFIPVSFELTILFAAFTAVISMLALNGLPQPYHPVFNNPAFARASQDRFFFVIEATDPRFDLDETRAFLNGLKPREVVAVED
jgi:hypothetical protein